jgi:hypothetical protein
MRAARHPHRDRAPGRETWCPPEEILAHRPRPVPGGRIVTADTLRERRSVAGLVLEEPVADHLRRVARRRRRQRTRAGQGSQSVLVPNRVQLREDPALERRGTARRGFACRARGCGDDEHDECGKDCERSPHAPWIGTCGSRLFHSLEGSCGGRSAGRGRTRSAAGRPLPVVPGLSVRRGDLVAS